MALPPLRVWLETGYDGGNFGAWMLDVPGAFGWARSRELAVSQSSAAWGWFRDWVGRHGEELDASFGFPEIAEEIPATRDEGYERNATFADDARPMDADELETSLRRMTYAREDLLALVPALEALPATATDSDRPAGEVLRHLAGAETWLGSRLDPGARFDGAAGDDEPATYLAATREWATQNLRSLHARD